MICKFNPLAASADPVDFLGSAVKIPLGYFTNCVKNTMPFKAEYRTLKNACTYWSLAIFVIFFLFFYGAYNVNNIIIRMIKITVITVATFL